MLFFTESENSVFRRKMIAGYRIIAEKITNQFCTVGKQFQATPVIYP
jgi:hypothetical protein